MDRLTHPDTPASLRLLETLRDARERIEMLEASRFEPLAIIGIGCRFPGGAESPEAFWKLLSGGVDAISEVPKDRWDIDAFYDSDPSAPGKMCTRHGGFLADVDRFDAPFFGIARREAEGMDPQQRLLLEVSWEALEHAGISPAGLRGTAAAVFTGIGTFDYAALRYARRDYRGIDPYFATGSVLSVAAGRLSYVLGLTGPSMAVDTACSSSLVAVHLACRSLRARECELALVGGVNVILLPELSINFSKAGMLAPDGRCKTFDASADGYVRGEGCGVVVLKRLSDAVAAGDRIWAVIRGSAVNQDGPSGGLTVPSGPSQEQVIRQALKDGNVEASEIGYIEAHGTGTSLGDPIEMGSLGKVFGGRSGRDPLVIGSVKTNVGHLEAAAGIAALIKTVLSLDRGEIPAHLHFRNPNPRIAWDTLPFEVPRDLRKWPAGKKRLAGVSAFGASGTNAHVVLEEGPAYTRRENAFDRPVHVLALSARSEAALKALAGRYASHLAEDPAEAIADLCHTANAGRAPFEERVAVIGTSREEIAAGCRAFLEGSETAGFRRGGQEAGKVAFLFTGQGSQYPGMGRALYERAPVFRAVMERCAGILEGRLPRPLLEVLYGPGDGKELEDTLCQQPALFAVEMALFELWRSWGIEPSLVMGHSVGEYAAACAAGVFSLEEGLKLVAERGRLMGSIAKAGGMAAVLAEEAGVRETIAPYDGVSVSALNGPASMVISGPAKQVDEAVAGLARQGIAVRMLKVSQAFHSALMEEVLPAFGEAAARVACTRPRIGIVSNVTGRLISEEIAQAEYWVRHARSPVLFWAGMETLRKEGCGIFLEVGPNPVLLGMGRRCLPDGQGRWLPSLRAGQDDWRRMVEALADLYSAGISPDWQGFDGAYGRNRCVLPTYPFQRQRYWIGGPKRSATADAPGLVHPLLGRRFMTAHRDVIFESWLAADSPPFLGDHRIHGEVVFPATGYVEMALAAGAELLGTEALIVEDVAILRPLILPEEGAVVQTILHPDGEGHAFEIFSEGQPGQWRLHAAGRIRGGAEEIEAGNLAALRARCRESLSVEEHYREFGERGIDYGPSFRGIEGLSRGEEESLGYLQTSPEVEAEMGRYRLHPGWFDAALQAAAPLLPAGPGRKNLFPAGLKRLTITSPPSSPAWSHGRLRKTAGGSEIHELDYCLYDGAGRPFVRVDGFLLKRAAPEALLSEVKAGAERSKAGAEGSVGLYETVWEPLSPAETGGDGVAGQWVIFADAAGLGEKTARLLEAAGGRAALVYRGEDYGQSPGGRFRVNPLLPGDFRRLGTEVFGSDLRGVVHLWSLDSGERTDLDSIERGKVLGSASVLHLVQALSGAGCTPRLYLVTRGAQAAGAPVAGSAVHQSPLWGLARVIAWEHPEFRSLCIDLDPGGEAGEESRLLTELDRPAGDPEERITRRGGSRYGARLVRKEASEAGAASAPLRMGISAYGILEKLTLQPATRRRPGPGEVEIEVVATGLNFRDVLRALGMLRDYENLEASDARFGFECSGRVAAVGAGVEAFRVGDEVIAGLTAEGSLGSYVTVDAGRVVGKPAAMSHEEGATIPLAFLTACYGLERLAHLGRGESVLIHAAAGGVGLAAIQIARRTGARIFATASPAKWGYLNALGVEAVMNSRTLDYAEQIRAMTGGRGVDVILNSLTGEYIPRNLDILAPGGRFVEIGKIGIWDPEQVRQARPDVRYHPFDLGDVAREAPDALREMLLGLMDGFARGELKPLERTIFGLKESAKAFRYMAQAKHIGKVVLVREGAGVVIGPAQTVLITGGLGALGMETARWLASRGARSLLLVGRSGASEAAREGIKALELSGVRVEVLQADVARPDDVTRILEILSEMPLLVGIVHAAGELDDGVLLQQDWERFRKVFRPKLDGAWNLHEATRDLPLKFFICYSSAAAVLGSAGQSSYGAANAFLDGLMQKRREEGLHGLSVNWGPWELGMAAGLDRRGRERMAAQGFGGIRPAEGFRILERLLLRDETQAGVWHVDWPRYLGSRYGGTVPPFFVSLAATPRQAPDRRAAISGKLAAASAGRRHALLHEYVREQVAVVLGEKAAIGIRPRQRLFDLGIDSLMAVELRNRLQSGLGIPLGATLVFDYPMVETLADHLLAEWLALRGPAATDRETRGMAPEDAASVPRRAGTDLPDSGPSPGKIRLEEASQDEIARMLAEELGGTGSLLNKD